MRAKDKIRYILENQLDLSYVSNSLIDDIVAAVHGESSGVSEDYVKSFVSDELSSLENRLTRLEKELGIK